MCSGFHGLAKRSEHLRDAKMKFQVFIFSSLTNTETTSRFSVQKLLVDFGSCFDFFGNI